LTKFDPLPSKSSSPEGRILFPAGIAVLFLCVTLTQATVKLLWGDELVTFWIGQQHSFVGIWRALEAGADTNPPLMHVLNWWSTAALGIGPVAVRLPSILAMGLALVCLWIFLRRRIEPIYAAAGCLALMTTRGFDYAYDACPYSLLMGFTMAALLLWSLSVDAEGVRRVVLLLGMAVALAAGLSSNYYGLLAFFPVMAGERRMKAATGRSYGGVWLAISAAAPPLLLCAKLVQIHITEFGPHAWHKPHFSMILHAYTATVEGLLWAVLALFVYTQLRYRSGSRIQVAERPFPRWERGAVGVLILYPVFAFFIALGSGGTMIPQCVAPVCLGFAIWAAALLARCTNRRVAVGAVAFLCFWVLTREAVCGYVLLHQRRAFFHLRDQVERAAAPGEPVVVGDSLVALPLYWYGSPGLRQQMVFPVDFDAIHRSGADDSGEQNLWGGRNGVFPVAIAAPAELLQEPRERVLIAPPNGWLAREMQARGYELSEQPTAFPWERLGGVFTPMALEETRLLLAIPKDSR
jgi:Dolichyl-phosphate-mannose-protein mannosyltransferase